MTELETKIKQNEIHPIVKARVQLSSKGYGTVVDRVIVSGEERYLVALDVRDGFKFGESVIIVEPIEVIWISKQ